MMKVIARMMVRGIGSTLKGKNAYPILGKPMIWWTLKAAREASFIDEIFVWTEDSGLSDIASECGCHVIPRTKDQVFYNAGFEEPGTWLEKRDGFIRSKCGTLGDIVVNLNCNLCLITAGMLTEMYEGLLGDETASGIIPVTKVPAELYTKNPKTDGLFPVLANPWSEPWEFPDLYRFGGLSLYHRRRAIEKGITKKFIYHLVDCKYLVDVHDLEDVRLAEYYLMRRLGGKVVLPDDEGPNTLLEEAFPRASGNH